MAKINTLAIDIESFSSVDLAKSGVYRYAESPDFRILLFGYAVDYGDVNVIDLALGEEIPSEIIEAIRDENVIKWAHNASFERVCLSRYLRLPPHAYLPLESWRCSMVWSAYLGLPLSLKDVGRVLRLEEQKIDEGRKLIRLFCSPTVPSAKNGYFQRNLPEFFQEEWQRFIEYNRRDVEVEIAIARKLSPFPVPDFIWDEYHLSERINDRGVLVDTAFARKAIELDDAAKKEIVSRMQVITGLENPGSVQQLKTWLRENDVDIESLGKKEVKALLDKVPPELKEVLELRLKQSKSSVKKYQVMVSAACSDGRARGMFMFGGASRTLRFSGRLIQLQNLPQNHIEKLAEARNDVMKLDYGILASIYDDIPDTLSQLIRTAFIPASGYRFIVSDFSAIEARVLSWLAGEEWKMEVFRENGDIYSATASKMFGVPVAKHGPNAELRQKGKQAELACGYNGSKGALIAMGALDMGMKEEELQPLVDSWRKANPHIVKLWSDVGRAAVKAVREKGRAETHGLVFTYEKGFLFVRLPSGHRLAYVKPRIEKDEFGRENITYEGTGQTKKWERIRTFGGKQVENIVQAIARDILCFAMQNLSDYRIVMHIHDEVVIEAPYSVSVDEITDKMSITPPWAEGLVLNADGYECGFYRKD